MRQIAIIALLAGITPASPSPRAADAFIVENGRPRAEIIISAAPTRMQRVAAHEFRLNVEKISGVRLPLLTRPTGEAVKVFIGASAHNPVKADGLKHGAYRIASGDDWLALIGDDAEFVPTEPWARNNGDIRRAQAEWHKILGAPYGMPNGGLYKNRLRLPGGTGKPDGVATAAKETLEIWGLDERGSFNAVTAFFHNLGARWYFPGELGEVMPSMKSIPLPREDEAVHPDFPLRQFNFRFSTAGYDNAMWVMHLGTRNDPRTMIAHGMATMSNREEVFARHPDWFALYGGKRDFEPGNSKCQLCYSNDELFRETVRYVRTLFDTYHFEAVSVMPPDGYTAICQCEKCRGKDSPERNERGLLSDHVWDFVNRVAKELAGSHPDKKVLCCAYGVYTLPPLKIAKLEPNVQVCIVGGRRPINKGGVKGQGESAPDVLRASWVKKTANPLLIFENYPFTGRGWYLPSFAAHSLGDTVNATKGISQGEDIWLSAWRGIDQAAIGFNHFQIYFTARMYWGGKDQDVDALLREYCRLFYGPAEKEMLEFFTYCEQHWNAMEDDKSRADKALQLFASAQARAGSSSVYGRRLSMIDEFLKGLRMKSQQLGQKRGPVPMVRLVGEAKDVVIDGRLDDAYWQNCPVAATGRLRELQTGREPTYGTTFKSGWQGNSVYFAIRCDERPGEKPFNTATRDGDQAIWRGDAVEIELATETHSYYQIAVSPAGAIVDLDRGASKDRWFGWDSQAEVATRIGKDHWTVEIRIPVTQDENDPLHQVIGRKPTQSLPWHINICRQRIRDDGMELSALSPTGTSGFHVPMKFAHFYAGRSHRFEADPDVTDFVVGFREAGRQRQATAYLALLKGQGKISDFQKSAALEQAALLEKSDAGPIIARIPIDAVKKTAAMRELIADGKAAEVVARYGEEDIGEWPFWQRGEAWNARGRAFAVVKNGPAAVADLQRAVDFTGDRRSRRPIGVALGRAQESLLGDDPAALATYRSVFDGLNRIGSANDLTAVQGAARILTKQGKFDEALDTLKLTEMDRLRGSWRGTMFLARAETLAAAGRKEEALRLYQALATDKAIEPRQQKQAEEAAVKLAR